MVRWETLAARAGVVGCVYRLGLGASLRGRGPATFLELDASRVLAAPLGSLRAAASWATVRGRALIVSRDLEREGSLCGEGVGVRAVVGARELWMCGGEWECEGMMGRRRMGR